MRFHALPYRFLVAGSRWYFSYCWLASFWCCSQNRLSVRLGQPGWWHGCLAFLGILPTPPFVEFVFEDVPTLLQIRNLSISQNNHLLSNGHNKSPHSGVATMKALVPVSIFILFADYTISQSTPLQTIANHCNFLFFQINCIIREFNLCNSLIMPTLNRNGIGTKFFSYLWP